MGSKQGVPPRGSLGSFCRVGKGSFRGRDRVNGTIAFPGLPCKALHLGLPKVVGLRDSGLHVRVCITSLDVQGDLTLYHFTVLHMDKSIALFLVLMKP